VRNKRGIVFILTAVFVAGMLGTAFAQGTGAAPAAASPQANRPTVAVVDMVVLLRAHPKLNDDLKNFNTQLNGVRTQQANEEQKLQNDAKIVMEKYKVGTPEYTQEMEKLEKRMLEFRTNQSKMQREFAMQDMKIKYSAFKSIREEIQNFAARAGVAVVLDVRGIDPEQGELENAQEEVGQTVVWNAPGVNMTVQIVQLLNQKYGSTYPATAKIVDGKDGQKVVSFLNTNQNDGNSNGPSVPNRPPLGPGQSTANTPGANPSLPR